MYRRNYLIKEWILLVCMLSLSTLAFANNIVKNVPFVNIKLNPKDVILANYSFGNYHNMLCYDNNSQNIGEMKWLYKGNTKNSSLPVVLTVNSDFEGKFADKNGLITITNTSNKQLIVSCGFTF